MAISQSKLPYSLSTPFAHPLDTHLPIRQSSRSRSTKRVCQPSKCQCHPRERPLPPDLRPRPSSTLSLLVEAYQSKTVRHGPNCSRETIANLAARLRLHARGTHHGNGGGNLQEGRTRQLRVGEDQGRVSRARPGTSSQHGRRCEFR